MASLSSVRPVRATAPVSIRAVRPARAVQARAEALTLKIKLKSFAVPEIQEASNMVVDAVNETGARLSGPIPMPTRRKIYCVLRSPHVNSKSREHFEIRTHQRLFHVKDVTKEAVQSLMNLSLPAGVDCDVRI